MFNNLYIKENNWIKFLKIVKKQQHLTMIYKRFKNDNIIIHLKMFNNFYIKEKIWIKFFENSKKTSFNYDLSEI